MLDVVENKKKSDIAPRVRYQLYLMFLYASWGFFAFSVFACLCLGYRRFTMAKEKHLNERARAIRNMETVCANEKNYMELQVQALCQSAQNVLDRSPTQFALYDLMDVINMCGSRDCSEVFADATGGMVRNFVYLSVLVAVVLYVARSCFVRAERRIEDSRYSLDIRMPQLSSNRKYIEMSPLHRSSNLIVDEDIESSSLVPMQFNQRFKRE